MIRFYYTLFRTLFNFVESLEQGHDPELAKNSAMYASFFLTVFLSLNLMTLFPETIKGGVVAYMMVGVFLFNYVAFVSKGRYKGVLAKVASYQHNTIIDYLVFGYIFLTIMLFGYFTF